jgi:17beta-estradiol 17-dehydrogenase / very-long-chain 3-oxoacyl-CoA reductase
MSLLVIETLFIYAVENCKLLLTLFIIWKLLRFMYTNFFRRRLNLLNRYGQDSWALVTGATDGIGKGLCEELAKEGFNIILVSRTLQKLKKVSADLLKVNPNIKTHEIEYDFNAKNRLEDYISTFGSLQDSYDISILINNVGLDHHNTFERVKIDHIYSMINLNVIPQTLLTKILLNKMNSRNRRSSVITLSSFAGEFPFPMKSLYSATKIFNHYLSVALSEEMKSTDKIDWLSVKPLEVETVMSTTKADGFSVITPKQCAASILNDLGYESETYTHWAHKLQAALLKFVPKCVLYEVFRRFWFKIFIKRDEKLE